MKYAEEVLGKTYRTEGTAEISSLKKTFIKFNISLGLRVNILKELKKT